MRHPWSDALMVMFWCIKYLFWDVWMIEINISTMVRKKNAYYWRRKYLEKYAVACQTGNRRNNLISNSFAHTWVSRQRCLVQRNHSPLWRHLKVVLGGVGHTAAHFGHHLPQKGVRKVHRCSSLQDITSEPPNITQGIRTLISTKYTLVNQRISSSGTK